MGKVLIYSNHWNSWWKPEYAGYTDYEWEAGIFDYEEAHKMYPFINYETENVKDYFVDISDDEIKELTLRKEFNESLKIKKEEIDKLSIDRIKAFETIKEHFVNIGGTRGNFEGEKPTNEIVILLKDLTKEEFDFLKEKLL